ncbi:MAG: ABC transporter ATP-binding protein [Microbacteriaceae bacterium]|nr:ABC transporter ATP-binding protein [Microbacteriaceae bacterium]
MTTTSRSGIDPRTADRPSIIRARGVRKSFPLGRDAEIEVLHGIDVDVHRGEFVAIMGASGSGKSTLLYALSGIDPPTAGTVELDGVDLGGLDQAELEALRLDRVGFVFQQPHLLEGCTLRENALIPALWRGRRARAAAAREVDARLELLGLGGVADQDAATASGGERQRAGLVRALVNAPVLLLADEPTGALDRASSAAVLDHLAELHAQGLTIVLVTHDPAVADRADRTIRVVDGLVAPTDDPAPPDGTAPTTDA